MHHGHHRHGPGPRRHLFRPFPTREELVERLESHQRDLEQELANIDDVLRHLRDSAETPSPQS
jgi:hypothetical protein